MSSYWLELRRWVLRDPRKLVRYVVLFGCCIIVIVQLYECFSKLKTPPLSTYSYYNLNETIEMPAVTICRSPPYKEDVLEELFRRPNCLHPKYTNCWERFPYGEYSLETVFINGTFEESETFQLKGYNGDSNDMNVTSSIHFNLGRCYTIRANYLLRQVSKNAGFSIMLKHHVPKMNDDLYEEEPGWHIFVHDSQEEFTEIHTKASGRVEYVFARTEEEIEIKLQCQHFSTVPSTRKPCNNQQDYSDLKCEEIYIWKNVTNESGCTGPWMPVINTEPCSNYTSMKHLTTLYQKKYNNPDDGLYQCVEPCKSKLYSTYIQNRKPFIQPSPTTQLWIYYTTKLITMVEDRPAYDSTQFIADIGGTLGFLLGLSVLGLIGILECVILFIFGGVITKIQLKEEKRVLSEKEEGRSNNSDASTINVSATDRQMS